MGSFGGSRYFDFQKSLAFPTFGGYQAITLLSAECTIPVVSLCMLTDKPNRKKDMYIHLHTHA
uniref:Uncharacterized protein n=1 Tax=Glossina palpalis gambiensis TaxID=67801 RepID=A0A1B0BHE7_9MUSC